MHLKRTLAGLLIGLMVTVSTRGAERFEIDSAHAFVYFTIAHFSGKARGSFREIAGTIHYDEKDISKSSVEVVIKTASVNTNNERRDTHLRSADFFDAAKYPDMTFKSRRVSRQGKGFVAVGDLTIKGVTKEVTMPFNITGPIKDPLPTGVKRLMVGASLTIDRREFGISWSRLTDTNELFVGNEVVVDINVEAIVPKPAATTQRYFILTELDFQSLKKMGLQRVFSWESRADF